MKTMIGDWDIWLANVTYYEKNESGEIKRQIKKRPVIIYDQQDTDSYIIIPLTSHAPRPRLYGEYQIKDLQRAGLKKPTVARCSMITTLNKASLLHKLGVLAVEEIIAIIDILNNMPTSTSNKS